MGQAIPPAETTLPSATERPPLPNPTPAAASPGPNGRGASLATAHASPSAAPVLRGAVTLETVLYAIILLAALLTRFWDLGSRALHHDESLHAYYSWMLATGQGYVHDPLMHGPLLFHLDALVFLLFGASDVTSRIAPAVFGVILVMLPVLLRGAHHLGRWGALAAATMLLISPSLLYQSRYIRHDIFTVTGALLLFIAIVRYIEKPSRGWLIGIGTTIGLLVANHEIFFGIVAIFVAVIGGALLWGRLRVLTPPLVLSGIIAVALVARLPAALGQPLPAIPWSSPTPDQQRAFYREILTHPLTIALALLAIVTIAAVVLILRRQRDPALIAQGWPAALFGDAPQQSVTAAVREAWLDRVGLSWAFIGGITIFAVLFTTLFTNLGGLATGTIATDGTLLYWLGQHDYRRGEQPWFYYLLLFPQYEFLAALFGLVAALVIGWRAMLVGLGRRLAGPRFVFQMFLAVWFGGILLALSWAGEKMPWLVTHITLPAILLAAALAGDVAEHWRPVAFEDGRLVRAPGWGAAGWLLCGGMIALAVTWFLVAAPLTYGQFVPGSATGGWVRTLPDWARAHWWLLAVPPAAALGAIGLVWLRRGARLATQPALAALAILLALTQIHAAWRLVYQEGDIPKDMLVYTQTSPDILRMTGELTTLSELLYGNNDLEIWYDDGNGVSWPMQWYLRDFPNRRLYGGVMAGPPDNAPVVLVGGDNRFSVEPYLHGYTAQEYVLRWWFPEDPVYRDFAIAPELNPGRSAWKAADQPHGVREIAASVGESLGHLLTMNGQQGLYRLVMYRDLPVRIDSYKYTLYVRNDLVPLFNQIRY